MTEHHNISRQPKDQKQNKTKHPNPTNYDKFQNILAWTAFLIMSSAVIIWKVDSRGNLKKKQFKQRITYQETSLFPSNKIVSLSKL